MFESIKYLKRREKILISLLFDCIVALISVWLAYCLRYESFHLPQQSSYIAYVLSLMFIPIFYLLSIYQSILRYVGFITLKNIFNATLIYAFLYFIIIFLLFMPGLPRSIGIIQPIIFFLLIVTARVFISGILYNGRSIKGKKKILIYGAGAAGVQILNSTLYSDKYLVKGFIDDDKNKKGSKINEIPIFHFSEINNAIKILDINEIFIAIPNLPVHKRNAILDQVLDDKIGIKFHSNISRILDTDNGLDQFKNLEITDLIGREIINLDSDLKIGENQTFLITGAGGSIGRELSKQVVELKPSRIILLDNTELNLYLVEKKIIEIINDKNLKIEVISSLTSVCDKENMERIFLDYNPNYVFHAAAYKHVTLVEKNISQAVYNNIYGTQVVCELSAKFKTKYFTLISTDKAVKPTNIMGSTKKISELIVQNAAIVNIDKGTKFSIVRFGNVFGSSGSVIQLFKSQIENRESVTVTDKNASRYFMSISEAVKLIIESTLITNDHNIFVLEMGDPINIYNLAKKMIRLSGLSLKDSQNPNGDIEIKLIGLKTGEKLHEELSEKNMLFDTSVSKIKYSKERSDLTDKIGEVIGNLFSIKKESSIKEYLQSINLLNK